MNHRLSRIRRVIATTAAFITSATVLTTLAGSPAWAAGSNMPWEQPLNQILQSVEGPVAKIKAITDPDTSHFGNLGFEFCRIVRMYGLKASAGISKSA